MTGTASAWGTSEVLGPMSAVVHRVNTRAQWRRAWALARIWTRLSRRVGSSAPTATEATAEVGGKGEGARTPQHPACFFPQEEMRWVRSAQTLAAQTALFL